MSLPFTTDSLTIKLASLAVHAAELLAPGGHDLDAAAIQGLLADPEVAEALEQMGSMALLPVRRDEEGPE